MLKQLKAGPSLDKLIAEKIMGWQVNDYSNIGVVEIETEDEMFFLDEFKPSSNINDAWEVLEKFTFGDIRKRPQGYFVEVIGKNGITSCAGSEAPFTICLAALKALGMEVSHD